jgi:hypothetical protein
MRRFQFSRLLLAIVAIGMCAAMLGLFDSLKTPRLWPLDLAAIAVLTACLVYFLDPNHWKDCPRSVDPRLPELGQTGADLVDESQRDSRLAERCLLGEPAAWEEIVGRFNGPIHTAIYEKLGADSSDLRHVDEIAARVWYTLVRNDGELLNRFDPTRHKGLDVFLCYLARIEATRYLRIKYRH